MRVNEQIRISPVRVINAEGAMLGVMPTSKALEAAREAGMDLVEVAPNERPPVCKIIDYGKFKYTQKKKLSKQKQHQVHIKEIRVRPKTGDHDIEVKVKRAREFLEHKDKVLVNVLFRGRELAHIDEGRRVMDEVLARPRGGRQGRKEPLDGGQADDRDRRASHVTVRCTVVPAPVRHSRALAVRSVRPLAARDDWSGGCFMCDMKRPGWTLAISRC